MSRTKGVARNTRNLREILGAIGERHAPKLYLRLKVLSLSREPFTRLGEILGVNLVEELSECFDLIEPFARLSWDYTFRNLNTSAFEEL